MDDNTQLQQDTNGYAGILLGLGLSGHLKSLKIFDINEFLTQVDRLLFFYMCSASCNK